MDHKDSFDEDILSIDWSSFSKEEKKKLLEECLNYATSSRLAIAGVTGFNTNARSLFLLMSTALALAAIGADNKTIVVSLIGLQMLKTFFSRLLEINAIEVTKQAKQKFDEELKRKRVKKETYI